MKVKRIVKFNIKKSHIDYKYIKTQLIESKEIYNFANYILRQLYFKNSNNHKYSLNFIEEYPTLKELFLEYIEENKQFSTLFYKIICEFSKLKQYSINLKIVQNIVDKLKNDWTSYWKLLKMKKNKTYDKKINIPRYKKKYNLVEYNNQVISKKKLKLGYIGTDKMEQGIKIANRHKELDCKCFRIYNKNDKILCELIYEKEIEEAKKNDRVASIDIGLENLFTIAFNYNKKGISIKGTKLKAINQYFNKIKASLQSMLPSKQYVSKVINQLLYKEVIYKQFIYGKLSYIAPNIKKSKFELLEQYTAFENTSKDFDTIQIVIENTENLDFKNLIDSTQLQNELKKWNYYLEKEEKGENEYIYTFSNTKEIRDEKQPNFMIKQK